MAVFLDPCLLLVAMAFEGVCMGFGPTKSSVSSHGVRSWGYSQLLPEAEQAVALISMFLLYQVTRVGNSKFGL